MCRVSSDAELRTRIVIAITATMMAVEIAAGVAFGSMALLADGWHMSTHVAAFMITAIAYWFSRRLRSHGRRLLSEPGVDCIRRQVEPIENQSEGKRVRFDTAVAE